MQHEGVHAFTWGVSLRSVRGQKTEPSLYIRGITLVLVVVYVLKSTRMDGRKVEIYFLGKN